MTRLFYIALIGLFYLNPLSAVDLPEEPLGGFGLSTLDRAPVGAASLSISEWTLASALFYSESSTSQWGFGLGYAYTGFDFAQPGAASPDFDLHSLVLPTEYATWSASWIHTFYLAPGLYSDMEDWGSRDLGLSLHYAGIYNYYGSVAWIIGLAYGRDYGMDELVPILGLLYQPADAWRLELVFPETALTYSPRDGLDLYASGRLSGGQWNVRVDAANAALLGAEPDTRQTDFATGGYRLAVGLNWHLYQGWLLEASYGREFERELWYDVDRGSVPIGDSDFIEVGISYNPAWAYF